MGCEMVTTFRIIFFIALLCLSALGLVLLLPFAKEGSSFGDLPIFAGVIGAVLILAVLWWLAVGRSIGKALIGWAVLALPLVAHGGIASALLSAHFEGPRLANETRIENYREAPLIWPDFDGPIGLRITLELTHPRGADAQILPPEIRMGPELEIPRDLLSVTQTSGSGYFKDRYLDRPVGDLVLLKTVLFQRVFENPAADKPYYKWNAASRFDPSGRTALIYYLLPGTVDYLPDPNRICLNNRTRGIPACAGDEKPESGCASPNRRRVTDPVYADGQDLSALWMAAGSYDMTVDLGDQLTAVLRARSVLQSDPESWTAMQRRLEPAGLDRAGYRLCTDGTDSHTSFRTCYCR